MSRCHRPKLDLTARSAAIALTAHGQEQEHPASATACDGGNRRPRVLLPEA
jgi:hypothetical protein